MGIADKMASSTCVQFTTPGIKFSEITSARGPRLEAAG